MLKKSNYSSDYRRYKKSGISIPEVMQDHIEEYKKLMEGFIMPVPEVKLKRRKDMTPRI